MKEISYDDDSEQSIPSPCRNICKLDERDQCIGCARTRSEIAEWSRCDSTRKAQIWQNVRSRAARMQNG